MSTEADRAHRFLDHLLGDAGVDELPNPPGQARITEAAIHPPPEIH